MLIRKVTKSPLNMNAPLRLKKHYQEIIGQYLDLKERGIIKQVVYHTDDDFADKLKQLLKGIEFI